MLKAGRLVIAVDGPAASGKGTVARALARHYDLPYLDTGLLYRAVGVTVARTGANPEDADAAVAATRFPDSLLDDPALRTHEASRAASIVSAIPAVRAALLDRQRGFARQPRGAVLDGRDIGTVIAPDADAKLFITARPEIRAARRHAELSGENDGRSLAAVLADIQSRDARDRDRAAAPLVMAEDAALLDNSDLSIEAAIQRAIALVEARIGGL